MKGNDKRDLTRLAGDISFAVAFLACMWIIIFEVGQ